MAKLDIDEMTATLPEAPPKPSKLKKIGSVAGVVGFYGITTAVTGASLYFGIKTQKLNYETAKLALETAKNNAPS